VIWSSCLFDWEMYPAVPYDASSTCEIIKIKWNKIKYNILYGALHMSLSFLYYFIFLYLSFTYYILIYYTVLINKCKQDLVIIKHCQLYRVIHKSLRDFRPLRYSSQDGHAEGEHVNRGIETPSFCHILQVLDMCTLGDF